MWSRIAADALQVLLAGLLVMPAVRVSAQEPSSEQFGQELLNAPFAQEAEATRAGEPLPFAEPASVTPRPLLPEAYDRRGAAALRAGQAGEAAQIYGEAVRLYPNHARLNAARGIALRRSGNPQAAVLALNWAVRLDPSVAYFHIALGDALLDLDDRKGARHHYQTALAIDPRNERAMAAFNYVRTVQLDAPEDPPPDDDRAPKAVGFAFGAVIATAAVLAIAFALLVGTARRVGDSEGDCCETL